MLREHRTNVHELLWMTCFLLLTVQLSAWILPATGCRSTQRASAKRASQSAGGECPTGRGGSQWEAATTGDSADECAGRPGSQWRRGWGWDEEPWLAGLGIHVRAVPAAALHSLLLLVVWPFPCHHCPYCRHLSVSIRGFSLMIFFCSYTYNNLTRLDWSLSAGVNAGLS